MEGVWADQWYSRLYQCLRKPAVVRCVRGGGETTEDATAVGQMSGEKGLPLRLVVSKIKAQGHNRNVCSFNSGVKKFKKSKNINTILSKGFIEIKIPLHMCRWKGQSYSEMWKWDMETVYFFEHLLCPGALYIFSFNLSYNHNRKDLLFPF